MNVIVARDGRVCVLDFGIARGLRTGRAVAELRTIRCAPGAAAAPRPLDHARRLRSSGRPASPRRRSFWGGDRRARRCLQLQRDAVAGALRLDAFSRARARGVPGAVCRHQRRVRTPVSNVPHWLHDVVMRGLERRRALDSSRWGRCSRRSTRTRGRSARRSAGAVLAIAAAASAVLGKRITTGLCVRRAARRETHRDVLGPRVARIGAAGDCSPKPMRSAAERSELDAGALGRLRARLGRGADRFVRCHAACEDADGGRAREAQQCLLEDGCSSKSCRSSWRATATTRHQAVAREP